eukprot:1153469-Pelagomonas_calceolata.AAC.5
MPCVVKPNRANKIKRGCAHESAMRLGAQVLRLPFHSISPSNLPAEGMVTSLQTPTRAADVNAKA